MEAVIFEKLVEFYASIDTLNFINPFPERHHQRHLEALKALIEREGEKGIENQE